MNQTASRVIAALRRESVFGTPPGDTGASRIRHIPSQGLVYNRAPLISQEKRTDANQATSRLDAASVNGSYVMEATVGGAVDLLLESLLRSTWTAAVAITQAAMTSITTTTTTIVAAGGSWITQGVRVGDIVRLTDHATAANNNISLRVTGVTASTLTFAGTPLTLNATPDTSFTLTILKKVVTDPTGPTDYSYTVDQYDQDIDLSEQFVGVRNTRMSLAIRPRAFSQMTHDFLGQNRNLLATGASPYFTSPAVTTGASMAAADASVYYNGSFVTTFTGLELQFGITAAGEPVIGARTTPSIYTNNLAITGRMTGIRQDFANLTLFDDETEFQVGFQLTEPGTAPVGSLAFWLPRVKILGAQAPLGGGDGAKIETLDLDISPGVAGSDTDATNVIIQSTAA